MKKILIVIPTLGIGGTTSSLESFLQHVDTNELSIDIYSRHRNGLMLDRLSNCRVLEENIWLASKIYNGNLIKKGANLVLNALRFVSEKCKCSVVPIYAKLGGRALHSERHEAVCSFQEHMTAWIAYMPAQMRIAWIRSEYKRYWDNSNKRLEKKSF